MKMSSVSKKVLASALSAAMVVAFAPTVAFGVEAGDKVIVEVDLDGGKNDRIYDRLSDTFTFEQAMGAKGSGCTHNSVRQMLKNWRKQGLIKQVDEGRYQKITNG